MLNQPRHINVTYIKAAVCLCLLFAFWCAVAWSVSGVVAMRRINIVVERESRYAKDTAQNIAANIGQRLVHVRSIPIVLSMDSLVVSALKRFETSGHVSALQVDEKRKQWISDPALWELTQRLNQLRSEISLHTLFVVNSSGDCIAAGKRSELPDFIGVNYSDRQYFIEAKKGHGGRQFAIGRTDNIGALFYSWPVRSHEQFIGAIVSRINIRNITNLILDQDVFVTDDNGVVILAKDSDLLMKAMPGAKVLDFDAADIRSVYKVSDFQVLDFNPVRIDNNIEAVRWGGSEYPSVYASATVKDELVTVHVLRDLKQVMEIKDDRIIWFGTASFSGFLLITLVLGFGAYLRSISLHRKELLVLNESLALQARTDPLTGCANRRSFFETLEAERQRGVRYETPTSILIIDIDHFKKINDEHGHPGGDQVLRHLVSLLNSIIRPTDKVGRIGGEEFGVVLPQTGVRDAVRTAERIRSTVEARPAVYCQSSIGFTISIGVSQWRLVGAESVDDLVSRCDKALYDAKNKGRNRVWCEE